MKAVFLSLTLCLLISVGANAQHFPRDLDTIPVEKFEEPSTEFDYGTFYNTIRTYDDQSHSDYYGSCVVFVDELEDHTDPACYDLSAKIFSADGSDITNPTSTEDWAFIRQKFECGIYSNNILELMESDEQPWGLFSEEDIQLVKSSILLSVSSNLHTRDSSDEDDTNRYECIDFKYREKEPLDIPGVFIISSIPVGREIE